jgi:hypothetical protein
MATKQQTTTGFHIMKITHHWHITREDNSEYTKYFCDNGYTIELDCNPIKYSVKGKTGRAINNQSSIDKAVKAVNNYYDSLEV